MFNKELFVYKEEEHKGYYPNENGELVLVPSATQLVGVAFPLGNIPTENLKNASVRGTEIHAKVEELNKCDNYEEMRNLAYGTENEDLINYTRLLISFKLKALKCEELVFLLDENENLICYGHYDMILESIGDTALTEKGRYYMFDLKTVSNYEDEKVQLQTEIYRTAFIQEHGDILLDSETGGIHLREGKAKIHFYKATRSNEQIVSVCKKLKEIWERENA